MSLDLVFLARKEQKNLLFITKISREKWLSSWVVLSKWWHFQLPSYPLSHPRNQRWWWSVTQETRGVRLEWNPNWALATPISTVFTQSERYSKLAECWKIQWIDLRFHLLPRWSGWWRRVAVPSRQECLTCTLRSRKRRALMLRRGWKKAPLFHSKKNNEHIDSTFQCFISFFFFQWFKLQQKPSKNLCFFPGKRTMNTSGLNSSKNKHPPMQLVCKSNNGT